MRSLKSHFLITFLIAAAFLAGCQNNKMNQDKTTPVAQAAATDPLSIHKRAIAVDMHADSVQRVLDEHVDLQQQLSDGHFDAIRAKAGGLDAQFFSIWGEPQLFGGGGAPAVKRPDGRTPPTAAMRGLNDCGKRVVRAITRLAMMVDVSHVSDKTFWDIVNTSTKPVVATHSACRAIADVPRNLTDDMIRALAHTGGVVNVIFYPEHIEPGWSERKKKVDIEIAPLVQQASEAEHGDAVQKKLARDRVRQREYARRLPPVKVSRIVDHIDRIVQLVGVDHVGIGSDFDGVQATTADLATVADLPNLTKELLKRGYSESDVDKILGGNMLRVMDAQNGK